MYTVEKANQKRDAQFIIDAQLAMAKESEDLGLDPAVLKVGVNHVFEHPEIGVYFVALKEGKPVGCMLTLFEWSDWRAGNIIWIHSVYTLPEFRKTGVYKSLYLHQVERVKADPQLRGLRLYVEKENEVAMKTYRALGMESDRYHLFEWLEIH